jgi:putative endonuclease
MRETRGELGKRGEELARKHLEKLGFSVLESNYRTPEGEIDLIVEKGDLLVFVEVRTRHQSGFGSPEESLTAKKRSHMASSALRYLQRNRISDREWRIDLVAIEIGPGEKPVRVDVTENAVEV